MRRRITIAILFVTFSLGSVPKVDSQGVVLVSRFMEGDLPTDAPDSKLWGDAIPLKIPLSSQVNFKPRIYDATASSLTIKSVNNGRQIAFLLEWNDETRSVGALKAEGFADAAAIQHPVDLEREKTWFCMGMPGAVVNIWYWNAGWEEDLKGPKEGVASSLGGGWDYYPFQEEDVFYAGRVGGSFWSSPKRETSVEDLNSARMQTLTAQPAASQNVRGKGVWRDGRWKVVFSRTFAGSDKGDTRFKSTEETRKLRPIAFAVWDGGNGEVDGRKAVSAFYFLDISTATGSGGYGFALTALFLTIGAEAGLVWWFRRRKKR